MSDVLDQWNLAEGEVATDSILSCCAARRWAAKMVARRPLTSFAALTTAADEVWSTMREEDWLEAFASHPRIGQNVDDADSRAVAWSKQEQSSIQSAGNGVLADLAEYNRRYLEQFGFTYIVCATGKSADEMLAILERRLANEHSAELREAAEQQRQIMQIRLRKWVAS